MSLEQLAPSEKIFVLKTDNEEINSMKHKIGDQFFLSIKDKSEFDPVLLKVFEDKRIIIEIESVALKEDKEFCYRCIFKYHNDPDLNWKWFISEEMIDKDFTKLDSPYQLKFLMMDK